MRHAFLLRLLAFGALSSLFGLARAARAQTDLEPPLPNVLLLVDSSGSMEWKTGVDAFPHCDPTATDDTNERSRWVELLQVLTGTMQNYRCSEVDRTSDAFRTEFSYSGATPPDFGYRTPYHRPIAGDCTPAPGSGWTIGSPYAFAADSLLMRKFSTPSPITTCDFSQLHDGLLDTYDDQVRFSLMTFDTHPGEGTGKTSYQDGVNGAWSYYVGSPRMGRPADCPTDTPFEVGARNAAAPPWEGRMVAFGKPDLSSADLGAKNDQIQQVLLATRPFSGTPIAGMLDDAREFLWHDTGADPLDTTQDFGPYRDPYIVGGCRRNTVILLSDGEPNLELRPDCANTPANATLPGHCPYDTPQQIAESLATATGALQTKVFVVGFALSQIDLGDGVGPRNCSEINIKTDCVNTATNIPLRACCTLNDVAYSGGTDHAYFAANIDELRTALSAVLSMIVTGTTSRTLPVFAPSSGTFGSYRFYSSFVPRQFQLWQGVIERQRYQCVKPEGGGKPEPEAQPIERTQGDDFVYRVNTSSPASRRIYSVKSSETTSYSTHSMRPLTADPDGAGKYQGELYGGTPEDFVNGTLAPAMDLTTASQYCEGISTASLCKDRYAKWLVGLDNGTTNHRCPNPAASACNLIADVYHSTPAVIGAPSENLRDESYQAFAATRRLRPAVLYTSTNDGLLHAFKVGPAPDETTENPASNNELWAFIPAAVLPRIPSEYPGTHVLLLDGAPVIREVPATERTDGLHFERVPKNAAGTAESGVLTWRTVLVQGFGAGRGGYFALDVTDPVVDSSKPNSGPKFLWQLTTNTAGASLFGLAGTTPLITTLYFGSNDGEDPKEVAVAVLPGGYGSAPALPAGNTVGCPTAVDQSPLGTDPLGYGQLRTYVNCYPSTGIESRSLTIVRLDTGEIIRSFRRTGDPTAGITRVTAANLTSPVTGQPAAYPGNTGSIATQLYVGDADGILWRVDVSSTSPALWTMKSYFDAYGSGTVGSAFDKGQPIPNAPKVSTDAAGYVTIAFATGDQELFNAVTGMRTYVWSLTETVDTQGRFRPNVNWFKPFLDGNRVSGPLYLFNGALYFSTFQPSAASGNGVCATGESAVWGMDYVKPKELTDRSLGGEAALQETDAANSPMVQYIDKANSRVAAGSSIFGVTVAQLPTCGDTASTTDAFYASAMHQSVSNLNPGQFQLIMHTGRAGTSQGGQSRTTAINLPFPRSAPRVDSWAAVVTWP